MPSNVSDPVFAPGFRFSAFDACILLAGAVASVAVGWSDRWLGLAIAWVVGHFFLFCNVLRMARSRELIWAAGFIVAAGLAMAELIAWTIALSASLTLTMAVAIIELRQPSYHGIAWQRINPGLEDWWRKRTSVN